ncbi:hypothetical protein FACS1894159_04130 [Bacteroidia bacterium]|nr:hypothetical protein FACS1894159_04130 [Bacteroidia bacterium]
MAQVRRRSKLLQIAIQSRTLREWEDDDRIWMCRFDQGAFTGQNVAFNTTRWPTSELAGWGVAPTGYGPVSDAAGNVVWSRTRPRVAGYDVNGFATVTFPAPPREPCTWPQQGVDKTIAPEYLTIFRRNSFTAFEIGCLLQY